MSNIGYGLYSPGFDGKGRQQGHRDDPAGFAVTGSAHMRFFSPPGFGKVIGHELGFSSALGFRFACKAFAIGAGEERVIGT
jgi:hypothetical protein